MSAVEEALAAMDAAELRTRRRLAAHHYVTTTEWCLLSDRLRLIVRDRATLERHGPFRHTSGATTCGECVLSWNIQRGDYDMRAYPCPDAQAVINYWTGAS